MFVEQKKKKLVCFPDDVDDDLVGKIKCDLDDSYSKVPVVNPYSCKLRERQTAQKVFAGEIQIQTKDFWGTRRWGSSLLGLRTLGPPST